MSKKKKKSIEEVQQDVSKKMNHVLLQSFDTSEKIKHSKKTYSRKGKKSWKYSSAF